MRKSYAVLVCILFLFPVLYTPCSGYLKIRAYASESPLKSGFCVLRPEEESAALESAAEETSPPENLYAGAAALVDGDSGRLLWGKNETQPMAMASTTKIMTCIIALENSSTEDDVTFSDYAATMPEVKLGASSGETFKMKDLLHAMMLESYNDTAVAIAEHIGGSVEGFAKLMNAKAEELGCTNTHFVTPNGLDADGHQTTAEELGKIASYAVKNDAFVEIISTKSWDFSNEAGSRSYHADNKDAFLEQMSGAFGIKTGFTGDAGYCFVGALKDNDRTFISVVLGSGWPPNKSYKWADTKKLMTYGCDNYALTEIGEDGMNLGKMSVTGGIVKETTIYGATEKRKILLSPKDKFEITVVKDEMSLPAPVAENQQVGRVFYKVNKEVVDDFPVYTGNPCEEKTFWKSVDRIWGIWLNF